MQEIEEGSRSRIVELTRQAVMKAQILGGVDKKTAKEAERVANDLSKKDEFGRLGRIF